jgi:SPP1 family predicted phage head-tail adaptor
MNPGLLQDRILLKYPTSSSVDRFGQSILAYASQSLWCNVRTVNGGENDANGYIYNSANYEFTLRDNSNITEKATITFDSKDYNIVYISTYVKGEFVKVTGERRNG